MTKKRIVILISVVLIVAIALFTLVGCSKPAYDAFTLNGWEYLALNRMGKSTDEVDITKLKVSDFIDLSTLSNDTYLYESGDKNTNSDG